MKWPGVFLLPPGWDASPSQGYPQHWIRLSRWRQALWELTVAPKNTTQANTMFLARGQFLEGPEKFSHPESHSKMSKHMISELFYSHILNTNRGSLHKRNFRRIHFSVFRYRWTKNGFTGPKRFRGFRETGSRAGTQTVRSGVSCTNHEATAPGGLRIL